MIKAVVFDLDGTLVHLPVNYESLFRKFKKILKTNHVRPLAKTVSTLDKKTRREIFEVWDGEELVALAKMTVNEKGIANYKKFFSKPKALVTLQGKALALNILELLELSFDAIFTREDSLNRTKQLEMATKELGVQFQNVLFVGNTESDYLAAEKVGCQFLKVIK